MCSESNIPLNLRMRASDRPPRAFGLADQHHALQRQDKPKRAFGTVLHQNVQETKKAPQKTVPNEREKIGGYWDASPVKRARSHVTSVKASAQFRSSKNPDWVSSPSPIRPDENACNAWTYGKPLKIESHQMPPSVLSESIPIADLNNSFTEKISNLNLERSEPPVLSEHPVLSKPPRRFLSLSPGPSPFEHEQEYIPTILSRWYDLEKTHKINPTYMTKQKEISYKMRTILIEWLVEVAGEYAIQNATLHRGVQFVDRFLTRMQVSRNNLQLLGTTCLFLASKIEEIHPPDTQDLVYITDNTYNKSQVLRMECLVLSVLDFDLLTPTAHEFTNYYTHTFGLTETTKSCSFYLIELTLLHGDKFLRFPPSTISLSSIYVAIRTCGDHTDQFRNNRTNEVNVETLISRVLSINDELLESVNDCVSKVLLMIISNNENSVCTKYKKFQDQPFVLAATSIAACLPFPLYDSQHV